MTRIARASILLVVLALSATAQDSTIFESAGFLDRYGERIAPPPMDLGQDISGRSLAELRHLRNELYARKGYLFRDASIRAYFQGKEWYQPIWWDPEFRVELDSVESAFADRIRDAERELLKQNFIDGGTRANVRNIVNLQQFDSIPAALREKLERNGFAYVADEHLQLFDLYEQNDYNLIPNFVTTDLYLQLLHMHFSFLLRTIEEEHFHAALARMLAALHESATRDAMSPSVEVRTAAAFAAAYCAVPLRLLDPKRKVAVPSAYVSMVNGELQRIKAATGSGSQMLRAPLFDYTLFTPRGHYTRSAKLRGYFLAMMWLQSAPLFVDDDEGMSAIAYLSASLDDTPKKGGPAFRDFRALSEPISWFVGEPDNLSIAQAIDWMHQGGIGGAKQELMTPSTLEKLRRHLLANDPERIVPRAGQVEADMELARKRLFFFPQRYTPDGEILQRLVHVLRDPEPKRPFPKGLDVFAALGNETAESILLEDYEETRAWPDFDDTLAVLKQRFTGTSALGSKVYGSWMRSLLSLSHMSDSVQPFMQSSAWQKRTLSTALAGWTGLKHDVILYAKQPMAIECGGDEAPPPPVTVGYVEPNTTFWERAVDLVTQTQQVLEPYGLRTNDMKTKTAGLIEMGNFLREMSEKELRRDKLSEKEYETIRLIGTTASLLTLSIVDSPDWASVTGPDRSVAIAADVYTYNDKCLQEAVGNVNSMYAVVEIDGLLYLTRGAVLSYYEFVQPAAERLTDEAWQKMIEEGNVPPIPKWLEEIFAPVKPLEAAPGSSYSSGC